MTPGPDNGLGLDELLALPEDQRLAAVGTGSDAEATLAALVTQVERLTTTAVGRAIAAGEVLAALADRVDVPTARVNGRRVFGQALAYSGRLDESLAACEEAIRIGEAAGLVVDAARARAAMLHPLCKLGRLDDAIAVADVARTALEQAGETALAGRVEFNLGNIHKSRHDPDQAIAALDRARAALADDAAAIGHVDNTRGEMLLQLNDFDESARAFAAAAVTFEQTGATFAGAIVAGNQADLLARRGDLQRALEHFERARRALEEDATSGHLARLLVERADAVAALGLPADALTTYDEAVPLLEDIGLAAELTRAHVGRAETLLRLRRDDEAERSITQATDSIEALGGSPESIRLDRLRAELSHRRGDLRAALDSLRRALDGAIDRPADAAMLRVALARTLIEAGALDDAEPELDRAIADATAMGLAPLLADAYHVRGRLRRTRGDAAGSLDDLRVAIAHVERVRGTLHAERYRVAWLGEQVDIYQDLVRAVFDVGRPDAIEEAFAVIERARSRALLETVQRALDDLDERIDAEDGDRALIEQLARLRQELNALYSRLDDRGATDQRRIAGSTWRQAIIDHERQIAEVEERLASRGGPTGFFAPTASLDDVRKTLPERTALIEYFIAGDEILAIVADRHRALAFRELARVPELDAAAERLHFQLRRALRPGATQGPRAQRLVGDAQRELGALHRHLVNPLLPTLENVDRLVLVPHGPLHLLPFHAFFDGAQYLLESYEVVYAPSASLHAHLSAPAPRGTGQPLVVGVADEAAPRIADEARDVAAAIGGTLLHGDDARAETVCLAARDAALLHLACHGRFWSDSPLSSGLLLADRWLTARDVCSLRLAADLVVLSGCDTGRSRIAAGDELIGLLRGFLAAGARTLVVSLWAANDTATPEIMRHFYKRWQDSEGSPAAALRGAQLEVMRSNAHPAIWAPFILMGQP